MHRTMLTSKIHRLTVTRADLDDVGSVPVPIPVDDDDLALVW